jgi:hypothetical protein
MFKRFLAFLKESPFIEGMGRIFDFMGVIESGIKPAMTDAEALNEDWKKVMGDFKHSIIIVEEKGYGREGNTQQQQISA